MVYLFKANLFEFVLKLSFSNNNRNQIAFFRSEKVVFNLNQIE